jgi:hypothetical protein
MNAQRAATELIDYLRQHILPSIARESEGLTTEDLWNLRSRLHALHHYCMQAGLPGEASAYINDLLSTTAGLWGLVSENEITAIDLKDYTRVRTLSAEAEGLSNLEELISGEDTLRDVIINSIVFMLNWKSNTIWIDSAKRSRTAMTRNYALELQDRIWQFINESAQPASEINLERANQIRERADRLMRLIQDGGLTTEAQVALLLQIYMMLLRLQLGKLIVYLEGVGSGE